MSSPRITREGFVKLYREAVLRVTRDVNACGANQGETAVHAARASMRRFEAAAELLPRRMRRGRKMERYLNLARKFSDASAVVSDCDVVRGLLKSMPSLPLAPGLLERATEERASGARRTGSRARRLSTVSPPVVSSGHLDQIKLQRRLDRTLERLVVRVNEGFTVVANDAELVEELHDLRGDCRKLRYLIRYSIPQEDLARLVELLVSIQDSLGEICDLDVAIGFASKEEMARNQWFVAGLTTERSERFREFVESSHLRMGAGPFIDPKKVAARPKPR